MDNIDQVIERLTEGTADHALMSRCITPHKDIFAIYNLLALRIARLFLDKVLSFHDADSAINALNTIWLDDAIKFDFPEPAYSVYLAFDAGEYSIDGKDHIELYTRPELKKLLENG